MSLRNRNPFYISLQLNFPLLDFYSLAATFSTLWRLGVILYFHSKMFPCLVMTYISQSTNVFFLPKQVPCKLLKNINEIMGKVGTKCILYWEKLWRNSSNLGKFSKVNPKISIFAYSRK